MKQKKYCYFCGTELEERFTEGRIRKYCVRCAGPLYENPVPATCIIVADKNGKILLVKRSVEPKEGFWCLPGGFMELDETPEQGALRELKEETGLSGKIHLLLGVRTNPSPMYGTVYMTGYFIRQYSGKPVAGDDASDVRWFNIDELPEVAFESHRHFIDIYHSSNIKN
ncbi:MAG: NUDIX hydrolase [Deltaproteobacteria bacterium]|nr:NUDIX hydrolase [Deltaproteobacteria bacterium]MBW2217894.1 NUDIX hydrolase [Deltaproteobacteria bacterium]